MAKKSRLIVACERSARKRREADASYLEAIVAARCAGETLSAIADATSTSHVNVLRICKRRNVVVAS